MKTYSIVMAIANVVGLILFCAIDPYDDTLGLLFWGAQLLAWFGLFLAIRGISYSNVTVATINAQLIAMKEMYDIGLLTQEEFDIRQRKMRLKEHVSLQNPVLISNPMGGLKTFSVIMLLVFAAVSIALFCVNYLPIWIAILLTLVGLAYSIAGILSCKDRGFETNSELLALPKKYESGLLTKEAFEARKRDLIMR